MYNRQAKEGLFLCANKRDIMAKKKRRRKLNAKGIALLTLLLVAVMTLGVAVGMAIYKKVNPEPKEPEQQIEEKQEETQVWGDETLGIDPKVDEELQDYRNILLLGIDNGGRSDVLMLLSINKKTNQVKSATVLRDTYMQIDPDGTYEINGEEREFYKCNRAYKKNGIYGAMMELNRHMDLNIRECITMDWDGMAKFIESMGGIEGDVESDAMMGFINVGTSPFADPDAPYKVDHTGQQHLNGYQAVQYLRARKYDGGSPQKRDARNQDALQQLFEKAKNLSMSELEEIYDNVANDAESNISRTTMTELLALISQSNLETMDGWPYEYTEMWQDDNSFYYFVPDTLTSNVSEFHKKMFGQDNYDPTETVKTLNEKIETARKEQLH